MRPTGSLRRAAAILSALAVLGLTAACATAGTPSVAAPPVTVTATVNTTTVVRTTATVTATSTVTPTSTAPPSVLVSATFKDNTSFECSDATVDSCWALDVTTTGPCPNGVYVAINVYKQDSTDVLKVLETTSGPIVDALGGTTTVQLGQTALAGPDEVLEADLKDARCA